MNTLIKKQTLFCLLLTIAFVCSSNFEVEEATCNICSCTQKAIGRSIEFNVQCIGDGTKALEISDKLFINEPVPNWTRKVYVKVDNFSTLTVNETFLSRWLAYTSCSFDIWNADQVSFPDKAPPPGPSKALHYVFAVIGVLQSSIQKLPDGIFKGKQSVGLKFLSSKVDYLNLYDLQAKKLNFLIISNSQIKMFKGDTMKKIVIAKRDKKIPIIRIQNCKINQLGSGALSFVAFKNGYVLNIKNSFFGIVDKFAIIITRKLSLNMKFSNVGFIYPEGIVLKSKTEVSSIISQNTFGVELNSLRNLNCNSTSLRLENNFLHSPDVFRTEGKQYVELMATFLDSSCMIYENKFIGQVEEIQPLNETLTTITTTTTSTTVTAIPNTTHYAELPSKIIKQEYSSYGLVSFVAVVSLLLLLTVIVLSVIIVWGKISRKRKANFCRKASTCTAYEEPIQPNAYFVPKAPAPRKMSEEQRRDLIQMVKMDQQEPVKIKKELHLCESDSIYLNMHSSGP